MEYHSKGLKLPRRGIIGLPLTHRVQILQKSSLEHHTYCITHHIEIWKFYKILVIKIVLPINNLSKLILKKVVKYYFSQKSRKSKTFIFFFFKSNVKMVSMVSKIRKQHADLFFKTLSVTLSDVFFFFLYNWQFFHCLWRKKKRKKV